MNVQVHAKGITLHQNTRAHIEAAIESFKKYSLDITTVNVNLTAEKKGVGVEFDIHVAHAQPVIINQSDDDLDVAIDLAIERATKALRRLHDKIISHRGESIKEMKVAE